jgi:hypothetical protein
VCFVGTRPVAALGSGALADLISLDAAVFAVAGIVAVAALLCRPARIAVPPPAQTEPPAPSNQTRTTP